MKIIIKENNQDLSDAAAKWVQDQMLQRRNPLLCVASGESPAGLYGELLRRHRDGRINLHAWYFAGLDEWVGLNGKDEGSCRTMLDKAFFEPAGIEEDHLYFFDGCSDDLAKSCQAMETHIQKHGGMDMAVLGLGMNGHIGLNEPGTDPLLHSHVTQLSASTQTVGQKYFTRPQALQKGITMGLGTLMEARNLLLIVSGMHKAAILKQALEGSVSREIPASLLKEHPSFRVYADREAASLLSA